MQSPPITVRELERADLPLLNRWRNDPGQIANLGAGFRFVSLEAESRWFDGYQGARANNVRLAVCAPDGAMIGVVYLLDIHWVHREAEFAIWIAEPAWRGRSCGAQATRLAIAHAFDDLNLQRLRLAVLPHNEAALRLYRRVGFRQEGLSRKAAYKQGQWHDVVQMGLLRDEYVPEAA
ncbi:GNAT family N-acetyltransferase [Caenimonas sedimenti]|uniref:GNAT family N-acetyltransferase n=1 Tax=Caenimonas sedimenti TaxID=2596921 RepID=A0A562ZGC5_9BURK|nr:GNAT family protein [Caenimonas sedimenti]TWO66650.1 GNAT family N-acetyltransferase [Caenimonas sedimenti]